MALTLTKLTVIVEILTDDSFKKINQSKLESALDTGAVGSSDTPLQGTGKKAAAARRALRHAFEHQPPTRDCRPDRALDVRRPQLNYTWTWDAPSRLEFEGLGRTPVPCDSSQDRSSCCLGRCRSSGQLDSGQRQKARARCGVLLMMFDQAGIDRGQWNLASELSLEPPPPLAALAAHQAPCNGEWRISLFSSLNARSWAELALAHLKDQEDSLAKRRNIGKDAGTPEEGPQKIRAMPSQRDKHAQRPSQKHSSAGAAQEG